MLEQELIITGNRRIAHRTFLMALRSPEMAASATPGQFLMIRVRSRAEPLLRRPFSLAGIREGDLFVLYRVVGRGTSLLSEAREGDSLSVLGPLGKGFELPRPHQRAILVAGGIGLAPLIFLAQRLDMGRTQCLAGFRSAEEIISPARITGTPLVISLATDDGTEGYAGPVTDLMKACLNQEESERGRLSLFACGPLPMLRKVAALALECDIPCQVSLEAAMACGLGACLGCVVKASGTAGSEYLHVCKDGPVFPIGLIDWKR